MPSCINHNNCLRSALSAADEACRAHHVRLTPNRKQVLGLIWQSHRPVKAYDLLEKMRQHDPKVKPPTVYRALDFLLKFGLIHRINSLNSFAGCNHPNSHADCYFMICQICGTVDECCNDNLSQTIAGTAAAYQFKQSHASIEITGVCSACQS